MDLPTAQCGLDHFAQASAVEVAGRDMDADPVWLLPVPLNAFPVALGNRSARRPRCLQFGVNWFQSDEFHSSCLCRFQFHSRSRLHLCRSYPEIASERSAHGSRSRARGLRVSFEHAVRVAVRDLSSRHAPPRPARRSPQERNKGYCVLFGPEEGRRSLDPTDEDLSAGAPALVAASTWLLCFRDRAPLVSL